MPKFMTDALISGHREAETVCRAGELEARPRLHLVTNVANKCSSFADVGEANFMNLNKILRTVLTTTDPHKSTILSFWNKKDVAILKGTNNQASSLSDENVAGWIIT